MNDLPALSCSGLIYKFGDRTAVDSIDFEVKTGEIVGLLGPNGAGKTTTIRMLVTILPPAAGAASIFGVDVHRHAVAARRLLGYVPQSLSADAGLTGRENVTLFAKLFDVPRRQRRAMVDEALEAMNLGDVSERMVGEYSGGMIRRLELAQALVSAPSLLVLDEPTVGLDPIARDSVWEHVSSLREQRNMTVLLTTHYMDEADALCDRVALMHQGRIRISGKPSDLKAGLGKDASLDDVFRHYAGEDLDHTSQGGDFGSVRRSRRTARRVG